MGHWIKEAKSNNDTLQIMAILTGIVILAAAVYYGTSKHKELVEKGVIRERPANFARKVEIFTTSSDFEKLLLLFQFYPLGNS